MNLQNELFLATDALRGAAVDYALCGGIAVIVHGYPRVTRDIDMLIREEDLERARDALGSVGFSIDGGKIPFDAGQPTERQVYRLTKAEEGDYLSLDLLLVSPFLEDVWKGRERHRVDERDLDVVSRAGLAKMKRAAGRPQDLADLAQLGLDVDES